MLLKNGQQFLVEVFWTNQALRTTFSWKIFVLLVVGIDILHVNINGSIFRFRLKSVEFHELILHPCSSTL